MDTIFDTTDDSLAADLCSIFQLTQHEAKLKQAGKSKAYEVNESMQLDPSRIIPNLVEVDSAHPLWPEWKAIEQHVSSFAFRRSPGRNCYFLVQNEYDGRNLGIMDVAADFLALGPRDRHIGWDKEQRVLMNRNIANISVPTRNFGYNLAGGKLLASLGLSREVGDVWRGRYGDELAGLTVTSLYGRGVQYNRLKPFVYLGETQGQGTTQVPDILYRRCRNLVEETDGEIPGGCFTKGKNSRINIMRRASAILGLKSEDITSHGLKRGIYWADRSETTKPFLRGEQPFRDDSLGVPDIVVEWRDRWGYRRLKNLGIDLSRSEPVIESYRYTQPELTEGETP